MKSLFALFLVLVMSLLPMKISVGSEAGTILRILDDVVGQQAEQERQTREQEETLREREQDLERREQELERRERQVYERETLLRKREQELESEMRHRTEELKRRERELADQKRQIHKQQNTEHKSSISRQPILPALTSSKKVNKFLQTGKASCELAMELVLYDIPGPGGHGPRQLRLHHSDLGHRYDDQIDLIKTMQASHVRKIRELIKRVYPSNDNYIGPLWNLYAWTDRC
ncbi:MAG: hypothetical protein OXC38_04760 [Gammaproteobacteria bacterium]|nr:hypothetical protein [Gammaproteobacteria bacterium]